MIIEGIKGRDIVNPVGDTEKIPAQDII